MAWLCAMWLLPSMRPCSERRSRQGAIGSGHAVAAWRAAVSSTRRLLLAATGAPLCTQCRDRSDRCGRLASAVGASAAAAVRQPAAHKGMEALPVLGGSAAMSTVTCSTRSCVTSASFALQAKHTCPAVHVSRLVSGLS